jgi:manganese transport protein
MVALILFTRRPALMGRFANRWPAPAAAAIGAVIVLALNALLLAETFCISPIG